MKTPLKPHSSSDHPPAERPAARPAPWLRMGRPALLLAPMEGVTDAPMRALMSERGGFSFCVSEFLRVSQDVPPAKVFRTHVPELARPGCVTASGMAVQIQLLGGDPKRLAQAALVAIQAGARAIDLNFGCPAPTVNRHDGGATLLKYPDRLRAIVRAVREAVPAEYPVSAKLRLGFDTMDAIHLNARMAEEGGASWITIHGRTKVQGYIPPAYWEPIGEVKKRSAIPVVANGEIWTLKDFKRCREETGCEHFMLGRGALADPALPLLVARELGLTGGEVDPAFDRYERAHWVPVLERFIAITLASNVGKTPEVYLLRRIKQWLRLGGARDPLPWFDEVKRTETLAELMALLRSDSLAKAAMIEACESESATF